MWVSRAAWQQQDGAEEGRLRPLPHQGVPGGGRGGLLLPRPGVLSAGAQD